MRFEEFSDNIKIHPVSISDHYRGESFGTKFLTVDGINKAGVDVSITDDEVHITHVVTADDSKRKGYAKRLIDSLFDEFPDKTITVSNMTGDGSSFFRSQYNVNDQTGEISLSETSVVWARKSGQPRPTQKFRCASGPRAGKRVSSIKQCFAPIDVTKREQMKKTRAKTAIRQARKARKTKRIDPGARLAKMLNLYRKGR
jgi:GNAT superfamily N-acetyltransferase